MSLEHNQRRWINTVLGMWTTLCDQSHFPFRLNLQPSFPSFKFDFVLGNSVWNCDSDETSRVGTSAKLPSSIPYRVRFLYVWTDPNNIVVCFRVRCQGRYRLQIAWWKNLEKFTSPTATRRVSTKKRTGNCSSNWAISILMYSRTSHHLSCTESCL